MAHVVVEPNRAFSQRLRMSVGHYDVYGGTVGAYWPDGISRRAFYIGMELRCPDDVFDAVCSEARTALLNRRPHDECTWSAIQSIVSRQRFVALKESGSKEVAEYVATFESELRAAGDRLKDAEAGLRRP
ncbi:MAG: hypothetical protein RL385_1430 [Pseudomonadota bacterium]|jgi:hypothetical protein